MSIHEGFIKTNGLRLSISGNIETRQNKPFLDLKVKSEKSKLSTLFKMIPKEFLSPIKDFKLDGNIELQSSIHGTFSGNQIPRITIEFDVLNGDFNYPQNNMHFGNINFSGSFDNGSKQKKQTYKLTLKNAKIALKGGELSGNLSIQNFERPNINVEFSSSLKLENLSDYFSVDTVKSLTGLVEVNMKFRNQLKNFRQFTTHDFISSTTTGDMKITNMQIELKNSPHQFNDFNGTFRFNNKDLEVDQFSGKVSGTDFQLKGSFRNILAYTFSDTEPVFISADLKSRQFNLEKLLLKSNEKSSSDGLRFSNRINYNLNINVEVFNFRKFNATNVSGTISQQNKILVVTDVRFSSMDGNVTIGGTINGRNPINHLIDCKAEIHNVNIQKLFHDLGNFGQQNLTDDHIRGTVNAYLEYSSTLSPFLKIDAGSVYTLADITVTDGELINYQPLQKLSKYIKEDELKHVRFSRLTNQVKIENKVIHIPEMDIASSSLNIHLSGNHNFDNTIDYHLQLLVSEIFLNKKNMETQTGNDFIKDDGLGQTKLYLRLTGNAKNPDIKYDTREVRDKISTDLKKEKETIKKVLQDEFKIKPGEEAQKDSLLIENESQKDFIIDWEESTLDTIKKQPQKTETAIPKKKKSSEKDFIIIWDEENDTIKEF